MKGAGTSKAEMLPSLDKVFPGDENEGERDRVGKMIVDAHATKDLLEANTGYLEDLKAQLTAIQLGIIGTGEEGFRHINMTFSAKYQDGRRTLDKDLLVENLMGLGLPGLDVQVVKAVVDRSYKQGDQFLRTDMKKI